MRPANTPGRCSASCFSRVCSPSDAFPVAAARSARPARAVSAGIRSRAHGEVPAAVPVVPKYARFAGLSATLTSIPSAAPAGIPASITADGSSSPMSGPAACQQISSITSAGTSSRHPVTVFPAGTCQPGVNGMSASSPARTRIASAYETPGSSVIAITSRMTSGYDISRRRSRGRSLPPRRAFSAMASITPSPRVLFQPAGADQVRQPRIRQHRAVPPHPRQGGHDRPAEQRHLVFQRRRPGHGDRPATADLQVSDADRERPRRGRPGRRGHPDRIAASAEERQDCTLGLLVSVDSTPNAYQGSLLISKPAQNARPQAHPNRNYLNPWC